MAKEDTESRFCYGKRLMGWFEHFSEAKAEMTSHFHTLVLLQRLALLIGILFNSLE